MQQQQAQLDQRAQLLTRLMEQASEPLRRELLEKVELSWIYHESALEGVVYSPEELALALRGGTPTDPVLVSSFDEIRQNKATIDMIRAWAAEKRSKIDADVIKDIYVSLAPDEVDGKKPPAYRKDIPLHRLYFHEIAAPDKIIPKLKAFGQWINAADTRRTTHALRLAAKAHFHLLHIYPYPKHSGKVARLVMNLLLLASNYPPAIIHSTERQRYYDALKTNENALAQIVKEALTASIESSIRFLEGRLPPPAPPPVKKHRAAPRRKASEPPVPLRPPTARPVTPPVRPALQPTLGMRSAAPVPPARPRVTAAPVSTKPAPRATGAKPIAVQTAANAPKQVSAKSAATNVVTMKPAPTKAESIKAAPIKAGPIKASSRAVANERPARAAKPASRAGSRPKAARPLKGEKTIRIKVARKSTATRRPVKIVKVKAKAGKAAKHARPKPKARRAA